MKQTLKFISLFLLFANAASARDSLLCSPTKVYQYIAIKIGDPNPKVKISRERLHASQSPDLVAAPEASCASRGCRYFFFASERGCYRPIGEASGELEILDRKKNGFSSLKITSHPNPPERLNSREWNYSKKLNAYVEE